MPPRFLRLLVHAGERTADLIGAAQTRFDVARLRALGVEIGEGTRLWGRPIVSRARDSRIVIGTDAVLCSVLRRTALGVSRPVILRTLREGSEIHIGNNVGLSGVVICAFTSVVIGDQSLLGSGVTIMDTDFHSLAPERRRFRNDNVRTGPVVLEGNNFIGAGATILRGVTIGRDSVVGAGAVVTRDVPAGVIAAGNPARVTGPLPVE